MEQRTFKSRTMAQALADLKRELGPGAVIISVRQPTSPEGFVEVVARAEAPPSPHSRASDAFTPINLGARPAAPIAAPSKPTPTPAAAASPARPESAAPRNATTSPTGEVALRAELAELRAMLARALAERAPSAPRHDLTGPLAHAHDALLHAGLPADRAASLCAAVRDDLRREELADPAIVRLALRRAVESLFPPAARLPSTARLALIGPPGAGKTTLLAKLAAHYRFSAGRRVAVLSLDDRRLGALEQTRLYARALGVPFLAGPTAQAVAEAVEGLAAEHDLILIDTPGLSAGEQAMADDLARRLDAAGTTERHAALPVSWHPAAIRAFLETAAPACPTHAIPTRLDELVSPADLIELLARSSLPTRFVSEGGTVPDGLHATSPADLAERLLGRILDPSSGTDVAEQPAARPPSRVGL